MKIAVYGAGYVGLVAGLCLTRCNHDVVLQDIAQSKIDQLNDGQIPIYEPGLTELLQEAVKHQRIEFTTDQQQAIAATKVHFIAVGTPSKPDGSANLEYVFAVANAIAEQAMESPIVVIKSTVPVLTGLSVEQCMNEVFERRGVNYRARLVSNPEFLREGTALNDFLVPDRVIIGGEDSDAIALIKQLYLTFVEDNKIIVVNRAAAELTKYAANAMLATKISFMNELSMLAERFGVDIQTVKSGIALDKRIGPSFIQPGCGYGGSCFPKDVSALLKMGHANDLEMPLLSAVTDVNEHQKTWPLRQIEQIYKGESLANKVFALWGLSFKPETDDMREAPSIVLINALLAKGAVLQVHDPKAMPVAKEMWPDQQIKFMDTPESALQGAHALCLLTEWACYRSISLSTIAKQLASPVLIDGRNMFDKALAKSAGLDYVGVGRIETCAS